MSSLQEEFIKVAHEIDDVDDRLNDALEHDIFDKASRLANLKSSLVLKLTQIYTAMQNSPDQAHIETFRQYLVDLQESEAEQLELLKDERETVRKEIINFSRGSKGKNSYQKVDGYNNRPNLIDHLKNLKFKPK